MADKKISALPAVVTPVGTDEFPVNQGGTTKKMTRAQVHALESGEHLVLPQVSEVATPTLSFGDGDSGFHEPIDDNIQISLVGANRFFWELDSYNAVAGTGPAMKNLAAGATVVGFAPRRSDGDTGIGSAGGDILSFVAGAIEIAQAKEVVGANQFVIAPGVIQDNALKPSLAFGDGDSGFYESASNTISLALGGTQRWRFLSNNFLGANANGPALQNIAPSATVPNISPDLTDIDTGLGTAGADILSLIAGGREIARCQEIAGAEQFIISPGFIENNPLRPALAFGDGDTGFYEGTDDSLFVAFAGLEKWKWTDLEFKSSGGTGVPSMINEVSSATNPVWSFQDNPNTGVGRAGPDALSLITGGIEAARYSEVSSAVLQAMQSNVGLTADVGSAQGNGVVRSTYNVYSTVGTAGDAATLPATFPAGTLVYIKNDAATNAMDVFPASGDNLGEGANTALSVAAGTSATFLATVANTTWTQVVQFASAGGDVTKVGTPVDNQIGVWTGDGTLEGDASFTWDGSHLLLPLTNDAVTPTLAFGDGDSGFYENADDNISVSLIGVRRFSFSSAAFQGVGVAGAGALRNETASGTNPTLNPNASDASTGIGQTATGEVALIGTGIELLRAKNGGTAATRQLIIHPSAISGAAATPSLAFGDGDTGFFESADDVLVASLAGVAKFEFNGLAFQSEITSGPAMLNLAIAATTPQFCPNQADLNTGLGSSGQDELSLVAGGVECMRFVETNGTDALISYKSDVNQTADVGSAQGNGLIGGTYNHYSTVANVGDAATLPAGFELGTQIFVVNDGANSMDVFPNTNDDAGAGSNTAVAVAAGASAMFLAVVANTTWVTVFNI